MINTFFLTGYTFLTYVSPVVCDMMSEKYIVRKELFYPTGGLVGLVQNIATREGGDNPYQAI